VPESIQYPEVPLYDLLTRTATMYPKNVAMVFFGKRITYNELSTLTDRFAVALGKLGVKKRDRVALFLPNMPEFVIAYYGAMKAGAIVTAVSPLSKERELLRQVNDAEAVALVALDALYPSVRAVWGKTTVKHVIVARMRDFMPSGTAFFGGLLGKIPSGKVTQLPGVHFFRELVESAVGDLPNVKLSPKVDVAVLQYTGGTTGVPKGAMLTHYNLVSNAIMCSEWLMAKTGCEVFLTALPLVNIYGMTTSMNDAVFLASSMVLMPRFDAKEALRAIEQNRVTIFCGVPTMYGMLIQHPDVGKHDLSSVKFCISGAAPLNVEVRRRFMKTTGSVLVEGYGLTECSPVTHCNPLDKSMKIVKVGSIGVPWPDTEAKIVDFKTGREVKVGGVGELVVRGPQVMKGYWNMPEETDVVLRDGWLYTGDVAKMDEDGYFFITGRKKDLIKYKGYSVYPRELEDVLLEHLAVRDATVVGRADEAAGEIPKAFVVLKEGATTSEKELMDFVRERVAPYKCIREIEFKKELPKKLLGKTLRGELRTEAAEPNP
jgi:long-chain acyl-CoA synthetase